MKVARESSVPILTYHSLDDSGSVISTAPAVFREQMGSLARRGFRGVALGEVLDAWEAGSTLVPFPVVLTFDDGYRNVREEAAPILAELGFRATVFAVADRLGGTSGWPEQPRSVASLRLLGSRELRELHSNGFEIGCHGLEHAPLDRLARDEAAREIVASRDVLQGLLGAKVDVFAYPFGRSDSMVRRLVRDTYRAACGTRLRWAHPADDRHDLARIDACYLRRLFLFERLGRRSGNAYLALRALGRVARSALGRSPGSAARGRPDRGSGVT